LNSEKMQENREQETPEETTIRRASMNETTCTEA
jgi:hypothetical protein